MGPEIEGRERKEIIAKNIPNLGKEIDIKIQEAQKVPSKRNPKRTTPRQIIFKWQKNK